MKQFSVNTSTKICESIYEIVRCVPTPKCSISINLRVFYTSKMLFTKILTASSSSNTQLFFSPVYVYTFIQFGNSIAHPLKKAFIICCYYYILQLSERERNTEYLMLMQMCTCVWAYVQRTIQETVCVYAAILVHIQQNCKNSFFWAYLLSSFLHSFAVIIQYLQRIPAPTHSIHLIHFIDVSI